MINAFHINTWGKFLLWLLLGIFYVVAGFVTFEHPLLAAAFITLLFLVSADRLRNMRIVWASA